MQLPILARLRRHLCLSATPNGPANPPVGPATPNGPANPPTPNGPAHPPVGPATPNGPANPPTPNGPTSPPVGLGPATPNSPTNPPTNPPPPPYFPGPNTGSNSIPSATKHYTDDELADLLNIDPGAITYLMSVSSMYTRAKMGEEAYTQYNEEIKKLFPFEETPAPDIHSIPIAPQEPGESQEVFEARRVLVEAEEVLKIYEADIQVVAQHLDAFLQQGAQFPNTRTPVEQAILMNATFRARDTLLNLQMGYLAEKERRERRAARYQDLADGDALERLGREFLELGSRLSKLEGEMRTVGLGPTRAYEVQQEYAAAVQEMHVLEGKKAALMAELEKRPTGPAKGKKRMRGTDAAGVDAVSEVGDDGEEEEDEEKTAAPAAKKVKQERDAKVVFEDLTENAQEEWTEEGLEAIAKFQRTKNPSVIPQRIREMVRESQGYLVESAITSREVAIEFHRSTRNNYVCRLHRLRRGGRPPVDGIVPGRFNTVEGTAYKNDTGTKDKPADAKPGHMHCGCAIDHVLLDFLLWKLVKIKSTNPKYSNIKEGLSKKDIFTGRQRTFVFTALSRLANLSIDDFYNTGAEFGTLEWEVALLHRQMNRAMARLNNVGLFIQVKDGTIALSREPAQAAPAPPPS
ncbi:hypothetical protein CC1G_08331 [Coprinopsis cinerea okayama7|uniref:Uncharacterized protein n=1 Tax=Coprinopsis cinerea (strain Okayama-7 / 130 / ATCC MYA-4618 / FGSC 9003) TaxID=240176 RepID=A8NA72_COPC7|nr:hypothetical protein CC1G_08331 [Coprinopsis cinerea okayama7\|eukprot:XP_001831727.1 hypothetical protein CC1G_08331 [Coprinopsis cinerea okayama7\